jgi:hypothetical protein
VEIKSQNKLVSRHAWQHADAQFHFHCLLSNTKWTRVDTLKAAGNLFPFKFVDSCFDNWRLSKLPIRYRANSSASPAWKLILLHYQDYLLSYETGGLAIAALSSPAVTINAHLLFRFFVSNFSFLLLFSSFNEDLWNYSKNIFKKCKLNAPQARQSILLW